MHELEKEIECERAVNDLIHYEARMESEVIIPNDQNMHQFENFMQNTQVVECLENHDSLMDRMIELVPTLDETIPETLPARLACPQVIKCLEMDESLMNRIVELVPTLDETYPESLYDTSPNIIIDATLNKY